MEIDYQYTGMKQALIKLCPGRFQILGPPDLLSTVSRITSMTDDPKIQHELYTKVVSQWFVVCSITNEQIPLSELKYWDVEKNYVYKSPEIIPPHEQYQKPSVQCGGENKNKN
jgi:hypothetical protein